MKLLIVSDIHGSETAAIKAVEMFKKENCEYMLLLGDVLYHGPRNPLPEGHNPKGVAESLNSIKDKIISVRGNCDADIDQMLLEFPCMADYVLLVDGKNRIFATHGHIYSPENLPKLYGLSFFFSGHTHVSEISKKGDLTICNPGSCALPKDGKAPSVAIYDNGDLRIVPI
jgi:hypothetical protein